MLWTDHLQEDEKLLTGTSASFDILLQRLAYTRNVIRLYERRYPEELTEKQDSFRTFVFESLEDNRHDRR